MVGLDITAIDDNYDEGDDATVVEDLTVSIMDVVNGTVTFDEEDFYNLIDLNGNYGEHLLEVRILNPGFQGFAFTFG